MSHKTHEKLSYLLVDLNTVENAVTVCSYNPSHDQYNPFPLMSFVIAKTSESANMNTPKTT